MTATTARKSGSPPDSDVAKLLAQLGRESTVVERAAAKLDEANTKRKETMREAHARGVSYRQIAKAARVAPQTVLNQLGA